MIITTYSGRKIDLFHIRKNDFSIEDIAIGLSHTVRFSGQIGEPYNVAQHSILVSDIVMDVSSDPMLAWCALMHDGVESITFDCPTPIKEHLWVSTPSGLCKFREWEHHVLSYMLRQFNITADPECELIKRADYTALRQESARFRGSSISKENIQFLRTSVRLGDVQTADQSKEKFLKTFNELSKKCFKLVGSAV